MITTKNIIAIYKLANPSEIKHGLTWYVNYKGSILCASFFYERKLNVKTFFTIKKIYYY